jgi:hypothetical protein
LDVLISIKTHDVSVGHLSVMSSIRNGACESLHFDVVLVVGVADGDNDDNVVGDRDELGDSTNDEGRILGSLESANGADEGIPDTGGRNSCDDGLGDSTGVVVMLMVGLFEGINELF